LWSFSQITASGCYQRIIRFISTKVNMKAEKQLAAALVAASAAIWVAAATAFAAFVALLPGAPTVVAWLGAR
jgi:uncharacterized membrane protein